MTVPPYQIQELITNVFSQLSDSVLQGIQIRCGQALGTELYIGCSNGELMRFSLQGGDSNKAESYTILSRQSVPNDKAVEDIVLLPSISRALVFSDNQIHFYTLPSLDVVSYQLIKPIRHVIAFAVDQLHLLKPMPPTSGPHRLEPVDFCVIKRSSLAMYSLGQRLFYQKEIPLPQGGTLARRIGSSLCIADKINYNMLNLETAEILPILPLNQDFDAPNLPVEPFIIPTGEGDFLVVSWTGQSSMGIFLTGSGDPVRGTLTWTQHPTSICLDLPHATAILPDGTIEIHNIDSQNLVQVIPPPPNDGPVDRTRLVSSLLGYIVPSDQYLTKMSKVPVKLDRRPASELES
ncbi:uncharacterized protein C8R40DRAFT_1167411 [Lentinula edodes]|uniref:uncharacterized protein n=1 Tax=Lentinula edodes TaxID=5353 RepID=UPI001E8ED264|nr:uncharacterized protein C8R40DRAFT_1167411 [Lentinula edodes]KAH7878687.1 hypothetical protein C8R40DRAFT_1167411 [Lentinula edodes]